MANLKWSGPMDSRVQEKCKWQEQLDTFFAHNPARLQHMRDASRVAADVAAVLGLSPVASQQLARAALAHDIGYAPAVMQTGYHPLDGAFFLEACGEDPWIVEAVLRHSRAGAGDHLPPAIRQAYAARVPRAEAAWLVEATTLCDWRAAGVGGRVSLGQRFWDIVERHPGNEAKARRAQRLVAEVRRYWAACMDAWGLPWLVCDIDNTLLVPGGELPSAVQAAFARYLEAGGRVSLASGKHPVSTLAHAQKWGLPGWHVAANGTCAVGPGGVEVVAHLPEFAEDLVAALSALGLGVAVYRVAGIEPRGAWQEAYSMAFARYGELVPAGARLSGPILKLLVVLEEGAAQIEAQVRQVASEAGCEVCRSDRHFLEILPAGCGKGTAARWIFSQQAWPVLASIAVGDNENDAHLFALCGLAAAVANAAPRTQATADLRLPACADAGVAALVDILLSSGVRGAVAEASAGAD